MSNEMPSGVIGDIQGALIRAGLDRLDSAVLAESIIEGPVSFKTNKLSKSGVAPSILVKELRAAGLIVRWTGENSAAV